MSGRKTITIDDRDGEIHYTGSWFLSDWDAPAVNEAGNFTFSNDVGVQFAFTFPQPAVSFTYFGLPRCCGGFYEICVDCGGSALNWQNIDAVVISDDGKQPPIALFTKDFGTAGIHTIIVRNQADQRFSGTSQITIDRIELVIDPNAASSTPPPATTSSSPATTDQPTVSSTPQQGTTTGNPATSTSQSNQSGGTSSTISSASSSVSSSIASSAATSSGQSSASATFPSASPDESNNNTVASTSASTSANLSTKSTPVGAIAGGVVGSVAVIVGAVLLFLWLRRKKVSNEQYAAVPFNAALAPASNVHGDRDGYRDDALSFDRLQRYPQNQKHPSGLSNPPMMQQFPGQLSAGVQYTVAGPAAGGFLHPNAHNAPSSSSEPASSESGYVSTSNTQSTSTRDLVSPPLSNYPSTSAHSPSASMAVSGSSQLPSTTGAVSGVTGVTGRSEVVRQEVDSGLIIESNAIGYGDTSLPPGYDQLFGSDRR